MKLPVLDGYPIQHLALNIMGMRQMGEMGAAGFLRLEGDTLTITIWDDSLLTPLKDKVGFAHFFCPSPLAIVLNTFQLFHRSYGG